MLRQGKFLIVCFFFIAITGCIRVPLAVIEEDTLKKQFIPSPDKAIIYIARTSIGGAIRPFDVTLDEELVAQLSYRTYTVLEVTPGYHKIFLENSGAIERYFEKNKIYFYGQKTFFMFLKEFSPGKGKKIINSYKLVSTRKLERKKLESTQARVRFYTGVTKDNVLDAIEKLWRLADGNDFKITRYLDGLYAERRWMVLIPLVSVTGTDYWQVKVETQLDGLKVVARVSTEMGGSYVTGKMDKASIGVTTTVFRTVKFNSESLPSSAYVVEGTALYDIFWARLEYLLGKRDTWMTCKEAKKRKKSGITWGVNEALCNSFNMKDRHPSTLLDVDTKKKKRHMDRRRSEKE